MSGAGKVALVTGGSSGIGRAAAASLAAAGFTVYELSRRDIPQDGVIHITADVTDESAVCAAVRKILSEAGAVDVLVACAGYGISGAVEFTELADAKNQFDVNFFGAVNCVKAVLPSMRERGAGRIICVSSVAGAIAIPFQTYYSATKAAMNAYAEALRCEVRPYGISVCAVLPGDIKTGFTDAREKSHAGDDVYGGRISRSVAGMEKDERGGMTPESAGRKICRLALKRRVKPNYSIGFVYSFLTILGRVLPKSIVSRLVYIMYAK